MRVKLLKELDERQAKTDRQYQEGIVTQANLLLEQNASAERAVLTALKLDKHLVVAEEAIEHKMLKTKLSEQFGKIYDEDQLEAICIKYDLRMLPTAQYKGSVDPLLGAKVREFLNKAGLEFSQFEAENFYIIAPTNAFNYINEDIPPKRIVEPFDWNDPIIVYKTSTVGKEYAFVHQWGNDFTFTRRILGFIHEHPGRRLFLFAFAFMIILAPSIYLLTGSIIVSGIIGLLLSMIFSAAGIDHFRSNGRRFWKTHIVPHELLKKD